MNFNLQNVKLKKVERKEETKVQLPTLCENEEDYFRLMEETYLEEYYNTIEEYTFQSSFAELEIDEIQSIVDAHKLWKENGQEIINFQSLTEIYYPNFPKLAQLSTKITNLSKNLRTNLFFVRFSSRSPKDAVLYTQKFKELFTNELQRLNEHNNEKNENFFSSNNISKRQQEDNKRLIALYQASTQSLSSSNGDDSILLFIASSRIQGDLDTLLAQYHNNNNNNNKIENNLNDNLNNNNNEKENNLNNEKKSFQVCVREWCNFEVKFEFRAFVYKKKLTAITQYNEFCFFFDLLDDIPSLSSFIKSEIEEKIVNIIPLNNLVIDIILVNNNNNNINNNDNNGNNQRWELKVVEINPFAEFAGSGLFSWVEDKQVLMGLAPFEFRVVRSPPVLAANSISESWRPFLYTDQS